MGPWPPHSCPQGQITDELLDPSSTSVVIDIIIFMVMVSHSDSHSDSHSLSLSLSLFLSLFLSLSLSWVGGGGGGRMGWGEGWVVDGWMGKDFSQGSWPPHSCPQGQMTDFGWGHLS